ncbi:mycothiol conjugate amidase Mca [soil metagenome]
MALHPKVIRISWTVRCVQPVTLRLLAVHAHPDDESSKGAATYAAYRDRGAEVLVVSCTGGEAGSVLNETLVHRAWAERDMAGLRRVEMAGAQAAMGIEHRWLGFVDSGLPEEGETIRDDSFAAIPLEFSGPPLVRLIREFRPQVLVAYDELGGYPHPDHIRAHEVAIWARDVAASSSYPELGEPWQVLKTYYDRIFNPDRVTAMYELLVERDPEGEATKNLAEIMKWERSPKPAATTHVPVGEFLEIRDAALRSHASQVAPDNSFFFTPNDVQREAWPYEDFELVDSRVETTLPENDLFAGIEDDDPA